MQENLVIVESPAKAKTIERFLGDDYKVMSSYGHIRDLKKRALSVDKTTMVPDYEIPEDKRHVVSELRAAAKKAKKVWLASDEDREGEAISWHLCEVLGLDEATTSRIVFHEITKPAILAAIEHPRRLDMNLVNAQQARRVLDRIVGFKLSPVLWRKVKPSLSAGRVQSVAVRLIVEREREVQAFRSEPYFRVTAVFVLSGGGEVRAEAGGRFRTEREARAFLEQCRTAGFRVEQVQKKPQRRTPAPPFTTSTLQQEAARKLGFTVAQTMRVAQHLYENGLITYMRTDSVNLSAYCLKAAHDAVVQLWGEDFAQTRTYHTSSKGAQEAHEAIRPTHLDAQSAGSTAQEKRLYELIWKRTVASQMADAKIEKTTATIAVVPGGAQPCDAMCPEEHAKDGHFSATGEVVVFAGFLKVYQESTDDDNAAPAYMHTLPHMDEGDRLERKELTATEKFTLPPARYTEASLVHKLEELGIGRPSTYAPTISTIQQREYVVKGDKGGTARAYITLTLAGDDIRRAEQTEQAGSDKGKLLPTDVGMVVNDFLTENFPDIMDYNFTARVEEQFDQIAEGKEAWGGMLQDFDKKFEPAVDRVVNTRSEHKAGERQLGTEPGTGRVVAVKIGRFGPMVQIGNADDKEKPKFAQMPADKSIESITLDEALELFRLPRTLDEFEGSPVVIGAGRFGPYVMHNKKYASLPKGADPLTITMDEAVALILKKREDEKNKTLKTFAEDEKLQVLNGRFGPYIVYDGSNYRLPKAQHERAKELTYDECMEIVKAAPEPKAKPARKGRK